MSEYILIAGDILPTRDNEKMFVDGNIEELFGEEIMKLFMEASFSVANLEGPLIKGGRKIIKSGPNICADPESINGIAKLGMNCLSLANNHILDYGEEGLNSTLDILNKKGIGYLGAGKDVFQAKEPYIFEIFGKRIGLYSCAEYEFTIADEKTCGANPFDDLNICDDIVELKSKVDFVIVLYHGMKELYRYPAPYVQKRCRKLVDKGADLVLCQHSHCIGSRESYKGKEILYGQGNYCFCLSDMQEQKDGLVVKVNIPSFDVEYIPVQQNKNMVRLASEEKNRIIKDFYNRSKNLEDEDFVSLEYEKLSMKMIDSYQLQMLAYFGRILQRLKLEKFVKKFFRIGYQMNILNILRCESHRDLYANALNIVRRKNSE